jgi:small conductance mechanosensitive channel
LWNTRVLNYSRLPTRMVDLKFGVAYNDDLPKGQQVLLQLVTGDARIQPDPAPIVFVNKLGDSAVELALRFWVANADYWTLRREMTERGKSELEAAGLSIPFPQRDVHVLPVNGGPQMQLAQSS